MIRTDKYGMVRIQYDRYFLSKYVDTVKSEGGHYDIYFNEKGELLAIPLESKVSSVIIPGDEEEKAPKVIESIGSDRIYTVNEVADILQVTPQKLRKHLRSAGYEKQSTGKYGFNPSQVETIKKGFKA